MYEINILEGLPGAEKYENTQSLPKWLNFVGVGKIGKTKFLVALKEHLRIAYLDCDPLKGTKSYKGTFLVCSTYEDLESWANKLEVYRDHFKTDIVVIDTLDGMYELIERKICKEYNTSDLSEIKIPQVGNGWSIAYGRYKDLISRLMAVCKCIITICHTKDVKVGKSEIMQQFQTQLNLPAGLQIWSYNTADANMWLSVTQDDQSSSPYLRVSANSTDPYRDFQGGCRPFDGLLEASNEMLLKEYLIQNFKQITTGEENVRS